MFLEKKITQINDHGNLYIDLRPKLDVFLKYESYDKGLKIARWNSEKLTWEDEPIDPDISLINPTYYQYPSLPIYIFISKIPIKIRKKVARYNYLQTTLLQYISLNNNAKDLFLKNSNLLWLMIYLFSNKKLKTDTTVCLEFLSKRQSQFIKKIQLLYGNESELRIMKNFLFQSEIIDRLLRWPLIPVHVLPILRLNPEIIESKYIKTIKNETVSDYKIYNVSKMISDIQEMGKILNIVDTKNILNRCKTIDDINKLHDRWVEKLNQKECLNYFQLVGNKVFPDPPIKGDNNIIPIVTIENLFQEGKIMNHCVGSYNNKIMQNQSYIYKVIKPERATLEIKINPTGFRLGELKLKNNKTPSNQTRLAVENWFKSS